jgi:putative spermidine/putrescine transport system substrate-binding protein
MTATASTASGPALPLAAAPGGPVLVRRAGIAAPRNPAELLDWARQNPDRFLYPWPPLTQGGRCFLGALPFLLGDRDPSDPVDGWDRSWDWLAALDPHVAFYPVTGAGGAEEFRDQECDMLAVSLSEDLLFRGLGLLPADSLLGSFEPSAWVPVATCLAVPRDLAAGDRPAVAALIAFLLSEKVQDDLAFGQGRRWSEPAHRDAVLEDRPPAVQRTQRALMRPEMGALIAAHPVTPPYPLAAWNAMFDLWEERIGALHGLL